jgi:hypothetical protein
VCTIISVGKSRARTRCAGRAVRYTDFVPCLGYIDLSETPFHSSPPIEKHRCAILCIIYCALAVSHLNRRELSYASLPWVPCARGHLNHRSIQSSLSHYSSLIPISHFALFFAASASLLVASSNKAVSTAPDGKCTYRTTEPRMNMSFVEHRCGHLISSTASALSSFIFKY